MLMRAAKFGSEVGMASQPAGWPAGLIKIKLLFLRRVSSAEMHCTAGAIGRGLPQSPGQGRVGGG
jgi:hypothetical protein